MEGIVCEFRRLKVGDYEVDGRLLVERKTLVDLATSIEDGRLFRQAIALANSGRPSLMILEGRSGDLSGSGMRREAVQGALVTVSLILGIPVLRAMNGRESANLMHCAARQLRVAVQGAVHRPGLRPKGKRCLQLHILQGLPNIGPRRAECLLETFGTVEGAFTASEAELRTVEGIGKGTARKIRWAARETIVPYDSHTSIIDEVRMQSEPCPVE
jgi:ERCC4-type nuclease